jgi:hypothetical protein
MIKFIEKLKKYSLKKQFFILFFIATCDVWIMPILSMIIYATGLDSVSFFQAEYREFLGNKVSIETLIYIDLELITHFNYYYIYIYMPINQIFELYIPFLEKFPIALNLFHIISFYLFIIILKSKNKISKNKKLAIGFIGISFYYVLGFFSVIMGMLSMLIVK